MTDYWIDVTFNGVADYRTKRLCQPQPTRRRAEDYIRRFLAHRPDIACVEVTPAETGFFDAMTCNPRESDVEAAR